MRSSNFLLKLTRAILFLLVIPIFSYGQYYNDVFSYKFNGTPQHGIKINTNIPFVSSKQMPTIMLEGYNYGDGKPIDIKIVYYIYANKFIRYKAVSTTSYTPDIHLTNENGKVVIFLDDQSYYLRFHVRVYANMAEQASWFTGWTSSDSPKAAGLPAGHDVNVPYETEDAIDVLPASTSDGGTTQIFAPDGGYFVKNGVGVQGAIEIKLPVFYSYTMLKFKVEVFNYATDESFTATISGYNYGGNNKWYNCSAQILATSFNNAHKVYFGDDGTNTKIWIGEPNSKWNYLKVRITEVMASHANISPDTWKKGWNIDLTTNNFSSQVNRTVENTLPIASGSSIWQVSNDDIYYPNPNGQVGIGTNSPTAELTVNGHIHAKEVRVYTAAGADFVFDKDYDLLELDKLEKFVTTNQHLPDIPSEKKMIEDGLHLGEMDIRLLQKVEELTLYIIEMNKKLEKVETDNKQLQKEIKSLKH